MATENKPKSSNGNKKKRQRYLPHNRAVRKGAYPLRPGVQGFFITCDGGRERQASHEAVTVIDSFYEELVHGADLNTGNAELSRKASNKKTIFTYSDSSGSEDDGGENEDEGGNDGVQKNDEATQKNAEDEENHGADTRSASKGDPENEDSVPEIKSDAHSEKQIQENEDNKSEETKNNENDETEAEVPLSKKQRTETDISKCGNVMRSKMEEKSVDKLIEAELAELADRSKRRFSNLDSGCNGVVFVQMRKRDGDPSPKDIVQHMMTSLASTKQHVSRFILRVLPVEVTCYASDEEIARAINPLISQYFPVDTEMPRKFAVLYEARANTGIDRKKIIDAVAKSVPLPHKVDLSKPDMNIVVQVVKTVCLIGIVEKYKELSKYNVRQLTSSKS